MDCISKMNIIQIDREYNTYFPTFHTINEFIAYFRKKIYYSLFHVLCFVFKGDELFNNQKEVESID